MTSEAGTAGETAAFFSGNGYYHARSVYPEDALVGMEAEFDRIVRQLQQGDGEINARWQSENTDKLDGGKSLVIHSHNVHRYSACWLNALLHREFLDVAEHLIGPDIVLHHNKLFLKPAHQGAPFPMHQDWWYFPTQQDSMIAAVIFLGDADDECGGFRLYPGSHKLGRQENSAGLKPSAALREYPIEGATPINARRGDVLFFSYFTVHGSMPNRSDRVRKTVLVQLYSGKDLVLANDEVNHVDEHLVLRGWNYHMNRQQASR